ncbi:hypothetical protein A2U01_0033080, partial [Trifolium medium]|nr:hypothetical protein [Trifolium medium]
KIIDEQDIRKQWLESPWYYEQFGGDVIKSVGTTNSQRCPLLLSVPEMHYRNGNSCKASSKARTMMLQQQQIPLGRNLLMPLLNVI